MTTAEPGPHRQAGRDPSARAVLFTVVGEYLREPGSELWTGTFVAALADLGFGETATRRALSRAAAAGWLCSRRDGRVVRWRASERAVHHLAEAAVDVYERRRGEQSWDGNWLVVSASVPETQRALRHRLRTQLRWEGFGPLGQGMWVSPRSGDGIEGRVRAIFDDLGLGTRAVSFVGRLGPVGSEYDIVREAWDLGALSRDYREFVRSLEASGRPPTPRATFARFTRMVHEWRGFALRDPGLPKALLPAGWEGHRAGELFYRLHDAWLESATSWLRAVDAEQKPDNAVAAVTGLS
jgi:phenylacetic acid degradation operon negative regulatory protein